MTDSVRVGDGVVVPGGRRGLLEVEGLRVEFPTSRGAVRAVNDVSFSVGEGEIVGLVGESGSGKSTILKALLQLIGEPGRMRSDRVVLAGRDLSGLSEREWREVRGGEMAMVFQDPVNTFNPSYTIGSQLRRVLRLHRPELGSKDRDAEILSLLANVGIDGRGKLDSYPFQFSQGQVQRIMIAAASASSDLKLLLADEPTSSLDVTIQAQVLHLLTGLRDQRNLALLLVTHDLAVVAETCDRVMVMYAGRIVEDGDVHTVFNNPSHPYTQQLLKSIPTFPSVRDRLYSMKGGVADLTSREPGCPFAPRCERYIGPVCDEVTPTLRPSGHGTQIAACHLYPDTTTPSAVDTKEPA